MPLPITQNTWLKAFCTYYVSRDAVIPAGVKLTLPMGSTLKFNLGASLQAEEGGIIDLLGFPGYPICLVSASDNSVGDPLIGATGVPNVGDHDGLVVNPNCTVNEVRVSHATIGHRVPRFLYLEEHRAILMRARDSEEPKFLRSPSHRWRDLQCAHSGGLEHRGGARHRWNRGDELRNSCGVSQRC